MKQKDLNEVKEIIQPFIDMLVDKYDIILLYVFGSYAKDKVNKNSDLDIAMLLKEGYNPLDKLPLLGELTSIFRRDDIDLVILNNASPVLKFQVIKYGKKLYEKSESEKIKFETRVMSEYMDMEHFRRVQAEFTNTWAENFSKEESK